VQSWRDVMRRHDLQSARIAGGAGGGFNGGIDPGSA
jgi:hypothetical protein